jgi:tRNA nucleotidyltransferase/poly(A) polymerase
MKLHLDTSQMLDDPLFRLVGAVGAELNQDTYVIGGYVRDLILNRKIPKDVDFVTVGSGIELAQKVAESLPGKPQVTIFKNFGTAMIRQGSWELEFVGARKESYQRHSRKPIVENGSLEDDQNRRDFTINAMALSLDTHRWGELIDPFNGLEDMVKKVIRTPLDPDITFSDDPLRMLRAVRFSSQLDFRIHPETLDAINRNSQRLEIISTERIADEFQKIMQSPKPSVGLALLYETGLLHRFLP